MRSPHFRQSPYPSAAGRRKFTQPIMRTWTAPAAKSKAMIFSISERVDSLHPLKRPVHQEHRARAQCHTRRPSKRRRPDPDPSLQEEEGHASKDQQAVPDEHRRKRPRSDAIAEEETHEDRDLEQNIAERIEHEPKTGLLMPAAGDDPVHDVGQGDQEIAGKRGGPPFLKDQYRKKRKKRHARQGQLVGETQARDRRPIEPAEKPDVEKDHAGHRRDPEPLREEDRGDAMQSQEQGKGEIGEPCSPGQDEAGPHDRPHPLGVVMEADEASFPDEVRQLRDSQASENPPQARVVSFRLSISSVKRSVFP